MGPPEVVRRGRPSALPKVRDALVALMRFNDRVCFASVGTIAKRAGCCERSVQYALRELERRGEIEERPDLLPIDCKTR